MASGWIGGLLAAGAATGFLQTSGDDEAGVRGRAELSALVARSLAAEVQPAAVELTEDERAFGLALTAIECAGVRVLATSDADEARRVARSLVAARELFTELSGVAATYPPGLRAFLFATSEARDAFLAKHPRLTPETRPRLANLTCTGIPGTADWAFWESDEQRQDAAVRLAFDWLFRTQKVVLERHAWLHEGLGFYLTHAFLGTRLTWFVPLPPGDVRRDPEGVALHSEMSEPGADWLGLARGLFGAEHTFDLEELLHLQARELDARDILRTHALAAYLAEVHRPALGGVLARVGADDDPRAVLEESLGFPFSDLRARLDAWLERREELVARAEGRRPQVELVAQWEGLNLVQKKAFVRAFEQELAKVDTQQLRWIRALRASLPAEPPEARELPFFDPKVHAPGQPIARKRLTRGDGRVKRLLKEVRKPAAVSAPPLAFDYDWGSAEIVRTGDPAEPESVFQNALRGLPPGADLARAAVLAQLDVAEGRPARERKLQAAFSHAYTDRDGNVYPLSLYELYATGDTIEMPDVDTLGIVHDVLDDWRRWVAPVPGTQHDALYKVIGGLFLDCKRARELRLVLADLYLAPAMTPRAGYESLTLNLQALWATHESDPKGVALALPEAKAQDAFLEDLVARCKQDFKLYGQGRRRAALLRQDGMALTRALGAALDAAAATEVVDEGAPATDR